MSKKPKNKSHEAAKYSSEHGGLSASLNVRLVVLASIIATVALGLSVWYLSSRNSQPDSFATKIIEGSPVSSLSPKRMPAEFEDQEAILLGGTQLVGHFPDLLADIVYAVKGRLPVVVLVNAIEEETLVRRLLSDRDIPDNSFRIIRIPIRTMWVRDFAPLSVIDAEGSRRFAAFHYRERRGNQTDNKVPSSLAEVFKVPLDDFPMLVEGGDFLSNGRGVCLCSDRLIKRNIYYKELNNREMGETLNKSLGFSFWQAFLQLKGEPTGHLDMFMTLTAPDVAVVCQAVPVNGSLPDTSITRILDQTARELQGVASGTGRNFEVFRIPMPPVSDGIWRTYTNVVFANGVLLVPIYPDFCPNLDVQAIETYRNLLPDWEVVGVDVSGLIRMNGALRCVTMNIPAIAGHPLEIP